MESLHGDEGKSSEGTGQIRPPSMQTKDFGFYFEMDFKPLGVLNTGVI